MSKADKINKALANGCTFYVTTYLKSWKITKKTAASWSDAGHPFFKMDGSACLMIEGQKQGRPRYACVDGAKIVAYR